MDNNKELITSEINQLLISNNQHDSLKGLQTIGSMGEQAIPILREALRNNENSDLKTMAIVVLGEIGEKASIAVPELINELEHSTNDQIRMAASLSLVRIGTKSIHSLKEEISKSMNEEVRFWASWALAMIDSSEIDKDSIAILVERGENTQNIIEKSASQEALAKLMGNIIKKIKI